MKNPLPKALLAGFGFIMRFYAKHRLILHDFLHCSILLADSKMD